MKAKELRVMNEPDLDNKSLELKKELMKLNQQASTGTLLKNNSRAREIKKTIAKILTVKRENSIKGGSKKE